MLWKEIHNNNFKKRIDTKKLKEEKEMKENEKKILYNDWHKMEKN